jgi:hypothetical protein
MESVALLANRKELQPALHLAEDDLLYKGHPVSNWVRAQFSRLLKEHEGKKLVAGNYAFLEEHAFVFGEPILLHGIGFRLHCTRGWVCQTVTYDVTLGSYDVLRRRVIVPNGEAMAVGPIERDAWQSCDPPPPSPELEPDSLELELTIVDTVPQDVNIPDLDTIIREREELAFD